MPTRVVLDTNILISAIVFGGKPLEVLNLVIKKEIVGITSPTLLAELTDILAKKFSFPENKIRLLEKKVSQSFKIVHPKKEVNICRYPDDNRVLEAAIEGNCDFIISGDTDLQTLKKYQSTSILTAQVFRKSHFQHYVDK